MPTKTHEDLEYRYACDLKAAGVPYDQAARFLAAGIVFNPKQMLASAAARLCDEKGGPTEILFGGARGGGKSHWSFAQIGIDDCQRMPGLKCLWLRKIAKGAKESLEEFLPTVLGGVSYNYNSTTGTIKFPNGSTIIIGSFKDEADVDKYLGLQYDVIVIEEITTLSEFKIKSIRSCLRTAKKWRPRMYCTANPGGISHSYIKVRFVDQWKKGDETKTRYIPALPTDNFALNDEYMDILEEETGWRRRAWLFADWDINAGAYFTEFRESIHVIDRFDVPEHWRVWLGFDYGYTHPTVVTLFAQDDEGIVYVVDRIRCRKMLVESVSSEMSAMLERNGIARDRLQIIAAGHDCFVQKGDEKARTIAEQYADFGWKLEKANIDRKTGASEIVQRLGAEDPPKAPTVFIFRGCKELVSQLQNLQHSERDPDDVQKIDAHPESGEGGDDDYDSFRYGLMFAKRKRSWIHDMDKLYNLERVS